MSTWTETTRKVYATHGLWRAIREGRASQVLEVALEVQRLLPLVPRELNLLILRAKAGEPSYREALKALEAWTEGAPKQ